MPLFLALNRFHILFWCCYCCFWTSGVFIAGFEQVNVDWQSIFFLKVIKGRPACLRLLTAYGANINMIKLKLTLNVPIPNKVKKIKLNFYFHTSLWCLKRSVKIKIEVPQRSVKKKFLTQFLFQYNFQKWTGLSGLRSMKLRIISSYFYMLTILIDFVLVIKIGYANTINTKRFLSAF